MNCFFLNTFDLECIKFLIKNLRYIHDNALMDLLPKMCPEDLDQRYFQSWNLSMHENPREIQLHLETNIYISPVNGWGPPKSKTPIGNLCQTRPLGIGKFFAAEQEEKVMSNHYIQMSNSIIINMS